MNRTKKTLRVAILALFTASLQFQFGCQPTTENAEKEAASSPTLDSEALDSQANTPQVDSTGADSEQPLEQASAEQTVVIGGDLSAVDWNSLVGQNITVTGDLVVVDNYDLARRGQVKVARERLYIPTSLIDPNDADPNATSYEGGSNVAKVTAAQKWNDNTTITLDDGSAEQNIFPPKLFPNLGSKLPTVRVGSVIEGVSGKLVKAGNILLLVPDKPLQWTPAQRPPRPDVGAAEVTIASFNVLNYFTTIDDGSNNARGADSESELQRQEAKLVAAIVELNADVVGLMEIENNLVAEERLVSALNQKIGKEVFQGCGLPDGFNSAPGGRDAIRVGIIYRSDRVTPAGSVSMIRDDAFAMARTPIVQTFKPTGSGEPFTLIVNHLKSKGGSSDADTANKDKGDGQGAFNAVRRSQALALSAYIDQQKQLSADPRILIIGDLNAYAQEDPIDALRAKGLVDLQESAATESSDAVGVPYSYVYRGQSGSLDHALATKSLAADVTGVAAWHINADEPHFLDYNQEYNPQQLFQADPFRSSDHDPVIIGIKK